MYKLSQPLVLASSSPRRYELLKGCGLTFEVATSGVDETVHEGEQPSAVVLRLAEAKAKAVAAKFPNRFVLAADTDVALGSKIFGKPADRKAAINILGQLSGQMHEVVGGIVLLAPAFSRVFKALSVTKVFFRRLTSEEIELYADTNEPYDKAGGYAAQGLGASFVESIQGSYTNVVGLDLSLTLGLFSEAGILAHES